jgi:hypothetical protein
LTVAVPTWKRSATAAIDWPSSSLARTTRSRSATGSGAGTSPSSGQRRSQGAPWIKIESRRCDPDADLSTLTWSPPTRRAWARRKGFDILLGGGLEAKILANRVHRGGSLNLSLLAGPGYYAPRGFVALQVGAQGTLTSLLLHTDAYEAIYPEVHNGFVGPSAPQWLGGLRAGFRAGPVLVEAHATLRTSITFEQHPPYVVPYMGGLRVGAVF